MAKGCWLNFALCVENIAYGITRKVALLCVVLSFLGWVVYVGGFGAHARKVDLSTATVRTLFFPYWISLVAGPVAFTCAILHIALSSRYPTVGKIMESITIMAYFIYVTSLATPFILSALFKFGASKFGDFEDAITNSIPIPSVTKILGVDSEFTAFLTGLVGKIYEYLEDGVELVVDIVLSIPDKADDSFVPAATAQFAGCIISIFFIATSVLLWPFFNKKEEGTPDRDLRTKK